MNKVMMGNEAAALAVKLARVEVVSAYPITPQTVIVESLADIIGRGELKARYMPVESEHTAMASCMGASLAGARTFTATSSQGWPHARDASFYGGRAGAGRHGQLQPRNGAPLEPVLRPHGFAVPARYRLGPVLLRRRPGRARLRLDRLCGCRAGAFAGHDQSGRVLSDPYIRACGCAGPGGGGCFSSLIRGAAQAGCE